MEYINTVLTLILIGIYWYNTKAQNAKINAQSGIINDLRAHIEFFDLKKIKEYVELRDAEKDKLLEFTRASIEREFELKATVPKNPLPDISPNDKIPSALEGIIEEAYTYIGFELALQPVEISEEILIKRFPKASPWLRPLINNTRQKALDEFKVKDIHELMELTNIPKKVIIWTK